MSREKGVSYLSSLVSVLLPVYNGALYVRAAIESILQQDYDNYEFIIVDNASTDGTAAIIDEYSKDRRVRVISNEKTVPRLYNFRIAFEAVSPESKWYKFIGDDDQLLPGCLTEMISTGEKYRNVGLVASWYYNNTNLVKGVIGEDQELISGPAILKRLLVEPEARATVFSPTSVLIAPEAYQTMGGFRTDLLHADAELFYRILNQYDLAYVHKPLTVIGYHGSSGQALSTVNGDTFLEAYLIRYQHLKKYDRLKLRQAEVERIKNNLVIDSVGYMLARITRKDYKAAFRHLKKIPFATLYHLLPAFMYFVILAMRKLWRREPIRLFGSENK
jgi:glycosyltransferase involved in cell wall biosynthesis